MLPVVMTEEAPEDDDSDVSIPVSAAAALLLERAKCCPGDYMLLFSGSVEGRGREERGGEVG